MKKHRHGPVAAFYMTNSLEGECRRQQDMLQWSRVPVATDYWARAAGESPAGSPDALARSAGLLEQDLLCPAGMAAG